MEITLANTVEFPVANQILQGIVSIFEIIFANRIRAYYLTGSYIDGTSVPSSDIDLRIIFKDIFVDKEEDKAVEIGQACKQISPIALSIDVFSEETLCACEDIQNLIYIKLGSLLVYGEDIREKLELPPPNLYKRVFMHLAFMYFTQVPIIKMPFLTKPRKLTFPINYPDPQGVFFGYDEYRNIDGRTAKGTKGLVMSTRDMAIALVAWKTGEYIGHRGDYIKLYRKFINDKWAEHLETIYIKCKKEWKYLIPEGNEDRAQLKEICREVLAFERHFLKNYKEFLVQELKSEDLEGKILATKRLGEIFYPDQRIMETLQQMRSSEDSELQRSVKRTIQRIQSVLAKETLPSNKKQIQLDSVAWKKYVGTYKLDAPMFEEIKAIVVVENDKLIIHIIPLNEVLECTPLDSVCFECKYGLIEFAVSEENTVSHIKVDLAGAIPLEGEYITFIPM